MSRSPSQRGENKEFRKVRWSPPPVNFPRQTRFCLTKEEFNDEYNLSLEGRDPKLLTGKDFSDEEWLSVWTQKRQSNEKIHLRNLKPQFYEECVLLYHQVYQTTPPNYEVSVHFAFGFTWERSVSAQSSKDKLKFKTSWAVFAESVTKAVIQQKRLNLKVDKWRIVNGLSYVTTFPADTTKSNLESPSFNATELNDEKSPSYIPENRHKADHQIVQLSNVNIQLVNNMIQATLGKLQQRKGRLEKAKEALDFVRTKKDEQVRIPPGTTRILEKLAADMEELKVQKASLVPNDKIVQRLEGAIEIRKETLRDLGIENDAIENAASYVANFEKNVASLQSEYVKLLLDVEEINSQHNFIQCLFSLMKDNEIPGLPLTPPIQLESDGRSILITGDCKACGLSIAQNDVIGVYMLPCKHPYHPLCFSVVSKTSSKCLAIGCSQKLNSSSSEEQPCNTDQELDVEFDIHVNSAIAYSQACSSNYSKALDLPVLKENHKSEIDRCHLLSIQNNIQVKTERDEVSGDYQDFKEDTEKDGFCSRNKLGDATSKGLHSELSQKKFTNNTAEKEQFSFGEEREEIIELKKRRISEEE